MSGAAARPAVSVIVPMFQSEETVADTLNTLTSQTFEDWEAIVVDDGSTDGGAAVVERVARRERRVRMIRQENRGLAGARNSGIAAARGKFLLFLDADDWIPQRGIEHLHRTAAGSTHGAAFGLHETCDAAGNTLAVVSLCPVGERRVRFEHFLEYNRFPVHAQMVAARTLGAERFREHLRCVEDYDLWLRLGLRGIEWDFVPEVVARYRLRPGSMSRDFGLMWRSKRDIMREAFARGRAAGLASVVDLSDERLRRFTILAALEAATAIAGSGRAAAMDEAVKILRECEGGSVASGGSRFSAEQAGELAHSTLPFAEGRGPAAWVSGEAPRYGSAMARFWERCEREAIGAPGLARGAFNRIVEVVGHDEASQNEIADRLALAARTAARPVVVLGLGRNGRRVARALERAGVRFVVRDDGISPGILELPTIELQASSQRLRVRVLDAREPWDHSAVYLMTVENDAQFLRRLPGGLEVIRWSQRRDALLRESLQWLRHTFDELMGRARQDAA